MEILEKISKSVAAFVAWFAIAVVLIAVFRIINAVFVRVIIILILVMVTAVISKHVKEK